MKMLSSSAVWEDNSPDSLLILCTRFCIQHVKTFCTRNSSGLYSLREGLTLPNEICETMFAACSEIGREIDDNFIRIFKDITTTRLRRVYLRNSFVTDDGLSMLLPHNLVELDISGCGQLTKESLKLINQFGSELITLNIGTTVHILPDSVPEGSHAKSSTRNLTDQCSSFETGAIPKTILCTPNLRKFSVHELDLPPEQNYFANLLQPLTQLTSLDLSGCCYLGSLEYISHLQQLVSLILYNVPRLQEAVNAICKFKLLRHLDISQHNEKNGIYRNPNQVLSQIVESLPCLSSLDISGTNLAGTGVAEPDFKDRRDSKTRSLEMFPNTDIPGLRSRVHNPLQFLGLFNTSHDACRRHHVPAYKVTGDANEQQILNAAQAYSDRSEILQKVLNDLYQIVRYDTCHNSRMALEVILTGMKKHKYDKHIQISGSASLFYIVKSEEKKTFNIKVKKKIIIAILDGMWEHKYDTTMMRNGCLTLCQFRIPQDVIFDYERLVEILLDILSEEDQDEFVQRISIYLLNSLACQVDGNQKRLVGDLGAIRTMLRLIQSRLRRQVCDDIMEIAWSTMWNVTDETPVNCERFLEGCGMEFFLGCLRTFSDKAELLRNMMGLLGNVAEVQPLRPKLMTEEYLNVFSELLDSTSDGIEVSYNAAGVLSHIASDGAEFWTISHPRREDILRQMVVAIERWNINTKRNINYRSFEPILRLFRTEHTPEAQHWAVWALANLTKVYPQKYCPLVEEEGGLIILKEVIQRSGIYQQIKDLAQLVINQCERFKTLDGLLDEFMEDDLDEV